MKNNFQKKEKNKIYKRDLEIDLDDNLNINKEITNKTSTKVLNSLIENRINTDSNLRKNISNNNKNTLIFSEEKSLTKKELRQTMFGYFNSKRRASINNFREKEENIKNSNNKPMMKKSKSTRNFNTIKSKKQNFIEYNDLYFEDDMFTPESSSFPNEYEADFLLKLKFIEDNDYNDDIIDFSKRSNSISYKINEKDKIHLKYFNNQKQNSGKNIKNFKIDDEFFDEKEEIGKNILYLEKSNSSKNIFNLDSDDIDQNKKHISYISLNLLLKKLVLENFKDNYSYLFNCIIQQFKYFIPANTFILKIFSAFEYYKKSLKINSSELINFLNEIIFQQYELIKEDQNTLEKAKEFFGKIKNIKFEDVKVNGDLKTVNYLLFININDNKNNDKIVNRSKIINKEGIKGKIETITSKTKSFFSSFKKNKAPKPKYMKEIKEKERKHNYKYFYIFDYTKEEIATYLTLESFQLISNIPEHELYNKNFDSKEKDKKAPNVMKIIERANKLNLFIIEDICSYDHKKERVDVIEKWLRIANVCEELKNYNDLIMINSLFCNYLLRKKLKLTWQKIPKKSLQQIDKLNRFCNANQCYKKIRKEIFLSKGKPYVPYLGILLKQLMGAEEMSYTINNNINTIKLVEIKKIIEHFFEFKKNRYYYQKPRNLEILSNVCPKKEEDIELIIKQIEPELKITAHKNDKKRFTQTDELFKYK